jgi:hypothetical protein
VGDFLIFRSTIRFRKCTLKERPGDYSSFLVGPKRTVRVVKQHTHPKHVAVYYMSHPLTLAYCQIVVMHVMAMRPSDNEHYEHFVKDGRNNKRSCYKNQQIGLQMYYFLIKINLVNYKKY